MLPAKPIDLQDVRPAPDNVNDVCAALDLLVALEADGQHTSRTDRG